MSLITAADQERLRETFAGMTRPVRLLFFTQTFGWETCLQAREIADELPRLSELITIEEVNLVLERDRAAQYGIDRAPAIALLHGTPRSPDDPIGDASMSYEDSRMRFLGAPAGFEFISLVQAVALAGGRDSALQPESRSRVGAVASPLDIRVFTTPTCPHCPRAVNVALEMANANSNITVYAIETTEFPDLARRYHVSGVPKTVVNDRIEILGALPEEDFIDQVLAQ